MNRAQAWIVIGLLTLIVGAGAFIFISQGMHANKVAEDAEVRRLTHALNTGQCSVSQVKAGNC